MRILLDNEEVTMNSREDHTLGSVVELLTQRLGKSGRGVRAVFLDGEEAPKWAQETGRLLSEVREVHILTAPLLQLLVEAAQSMRAYLPQLEGELAQVVDRFLQGADREGSSLMGHVTEGLNWYAVFLADFVRMGISESAEAEQRLEAIRDKLQRIVNVWTQGDYGFLADLLQYELIPELNKGRTWLDRWVEARETCGD